MNVAELIQDGTRAEPAPAGSPVHNTTVSRTTESADASANGAYTALPPTRLLDTRTNGETLGPSDSLSLTVTGGSVPVAATAVALNVTVTDTTTSSFLTVYPAGGTLPLLSNLNWVSGDTVPNLVIVPVGSGGQVTLYNALGRTDVVVDLEGYFAPEAVGSTAGSYVPLTPARITDTRLGSGYPNAGDTMGPNSSLNVQVTGAGDVPSSGVAAALLNVTVTDTTAPSFLTVSPEGSTPPLASNLNWVDGTTVANRALVPVGPSGEITLFNAAGSTDVVVDVDGYFTDGSTTPGTASLFSTISPVRVLDTRRTGQTLDSGGVLTQQLAAVDGIASNATAVVTNVTATNTTAPSFFTVYPGGSKPTASDLNWVSGETVPNLTVATLSGTGSISVYNAAGRVDLIIDAFAYFVPESPQPLVITTTSLPAPIQDVAYSTSLSAYGGTPPYAWAVTSGSLAAGLNLSSGGLISGTPSAAGAFSFSVEATDSTTPTAETATAAFSGTAATAPSPVITTTSLPNGTVGAGYSTTLHASNGTPPYSWAIISGSLPSGLSLSTGGVIAGTPTTATTLSFTAQVTDSASPAPQSSEAHLSIIVYLAPPLLYGSPNWSGYEIANGPYSYVSGTFNVPSLYATVTETLVSTWAGIDGVSNSDLIQAGVQEMYDPNTGFIYLLPWWEILPAAETPISGMSVLPGDTMTVTIGQLSGTDWAIELTNDTTGVSFVTDQTYTGPGTSVEWIVEAPEVGGLITSLADYTPAVTFTGLSLTGAQNMLNEWIMYQGDVQVSTPSTLNATGFAVAYGDVAPSPP
ncbi:MAG: G1 family glutamic endopeptidase [Candidatus Dormiibacterota bacterium]